MGRISPGKRLLVAESTSIFMFGVVGLTSVNVLGVNA
jgi:hypothetical protein